MTITFAPGSDQEVERFHELQEKLVTQFRDVFPNPAVPRTVVVIPGLSLDTEVLAKIDGVEHYEERMLCMLMLLRMPRTRIVYVTSTPIHPSIIDYYLHLLQGVPATHARQRLTLLSCHDASLGTVTEKILARPRLLQRIKDSISDPDAAHMACFNATTAERTLAVQLGIPLYANDPDLGDLGSKSGSREVFDDAGVQAPPGFGRLRDMKDVARALGDLRRLHPNLKRAVVKLEEGTSGEGNALFSFEGCPTGGDPMSWVREELPRRLEYEFAAESWESYAAKYARMGGITEAFIEGLDKQSPSVQCRIDPLGHIELISTHDQILGGPSGQMFLASTFPADPRYRVEIQEASLRVAEYLRDRRVLARFGVDFVSVPAVHGWDHYAIEINLRKGGTTHPYMALQFLTDGTYDPDTGLFRTPTGQARYYYASDNLKNPDYRRLTPRDLIDLVVENGLHFHGATQQGVVFHLIGAVSQYGKLGVLCVAESLDAAHRMYLDTVDVLDRETRV